MAVQAVVLLKGIPSSGTKTHYCVGKEREGVPNRPAPKKEGN